MAAEIDPAASEGIREIERLVGRLETSSDAAGAAEARELVRGVLSFHRAALERMLAIAKAEQGTRVLDAWSDDELVASLLVLHGLHPKSIESRARDVVGRLARQHDGLCLVGVDAGVVRLELRARGAAATLVRRVIESEIVESLPDALGVEFIDEPPLVQLRRKAP